MPLLLPEICVEMLLLLNVNVKGIKAGGIAEGAQGRGKRRMLAVKNEQMKGIALLGRS